LSSQVDWQSGIYGPGIDLVSSPGDAKIYATEIWNSNINMPSGRSQTAGTSVNGKIYVIGGKNAGDMELNTIEEYNPATDSWDTKTSMPTARRGLTATTVNGKIYVIGGVRSWGVSGDFFDTIEEYNPATDSWDTKTSMPTARVGAASATLNEKIYVFGGATAGASFLGTVEEYNPATDSWDTKTSMPTARENAVAATVNNKIYIIGGDDTVNPTTVVEEYDPATDSWDTKTSMPTARTCSFVGVVNDKIYVIGGLDVDNNPVATVEEYDPATDSWDTKTSMPTVRSCGASGLYNNNEIFAIGGNDNISNLDTNESYIPSTQQDLHTSGTTQIDAGANISGWTTFEPEADIPANTSISYRFRTSSDGTTWTDWSASQVHAASIDISGQNGDNRYFQVETTLSNTDGTSTPILHSYTINYTVSEPDPCADFDHVELHMSPAGKQAQLSGGETYSFSAIAYDTGGGTIDTNFTFSGLEGIGTFNQTGTSGSATWKTPGNLAVGDYTLTVSACSGSTSITMTKPQEPIPPPEPNCCDNYDHTTITPDGGTYQPKSQLTVSAQAIAKNGTTLNCAGSVNFSASSTSGGSITPAGLLTMPEPEGKIVVTASHNCGSKTATFFTREADCTNYDHLEILPNKVKVMVGQSFDFDALAYKKDGSEYGQNDLGFSYSAQKGSIDSNGLYTAPNSPGKDTITVTDDCGGKATATVTIIKSPKYCEGGKLDFDQPNGVWNKERTTYLVYTKTAEVFGEDKPHFEIVPKLTLAKQGNVTNKTDFSYQKLSPATANFVNNVFYPEITGGIARAQVTALAGGCFYNATVKFILVGPPGPHCGLEITQPEKDDIWYINSREKINWTSNCVDEWIDQIIIELSTDNGKNWQQIVKNYPNTNQYDWNIPDDQSLVTNQAKIRITAATAQGSILAGDDSDRFTIKSRRPPYIPEITPETKTQLAAEGPLVSLLFLGLLWPYLIGALDRNRFFSDLANLLNFWIQEGKFFFFLKKRPKKWGVVYDYQDKLPLAYAKIMLFEKKSDRLKETYITNNRGEFGFLVEPDDYYLNVQKSGYNWALKAKEAPKVNQLENKDGSSKPGKEKDLWREGVSDGYYSNLYFGQIIDKSKIQNPKSKTAGEGKDIKSGKVKLQLSIPLIMIERTLFNIVLSIVRRITNFFYRFRIPILIAGTLVAIYLLIAQRTLADAIVFGIYILLWMVELLKAQQLRGYGKVLDNKGQGVGLAMVRAFNQAGRMIQSQVTGPDGRFILSCRPQKLTLKVRKPGYNIRKIRFNLKSLDDISKLNIRLRKI